MESILQRHGFTREDKNAKYAHLNVEEFKQSSDLINTRDRLREMKKVNSDEVSESKK